MSEREETFEEVLGYMTAHESCDAEEAFFDRAAWRELIVRLRAAHQREVAANDAEIARLKTALNPVLELAGCMTNMSIIHAVHYKATHASLKYENGTLVQIEDPIAQEYKLLEDQFIPVFKMLKDAVIEAKRIMKEGGVA